jgi:hypothetical protein
MSGEKSEGSDRDPFVRLVCKMLLTFFTVIAVDLVAVSLLTQKLRVWFPVWLDAHWATCTDPWVVYSRSHFAGIFFIPLLSTSLDRHVLRRRPGWGVEDLKCALRIDGLKAPASERPHVEVAHLQIVIVGAINRG